MFQLIPNWKETIRFAWSVRFIAIAFVLAGAQGVIALLDKEAPGWLVVLTPVIAAAAGLARIVAQKNLPDFLTDTSGAIGRKTAGGAAVVAAVMAMAVPITAKWEGLRTEAYRDVVGVWTVCYGETEGVQPGDVHSSAECAGMLEERLLEDYYRPLAACIPTLVTAPIEVQAALTSWTYNVGTGAACRSTLARYARAGQWEAACNELPRWNRAGGRVWQGLVNRRADERGLCLSGL